MTFREILAEFAAHRQGVDAQYEVHLFQRVSPRGEALEPGSQTVHVELWEFHVALVLRGMQAHAEESGLAGQPS